ncbi:MAG: radical SAM protein [Nitrospirae bacterium]|nr:radical SAM protein [Nitrospirota bacterium]
MIRYKELFLGPKCDNKCLFCYYRLGNYEQPDFNTINNLLGQTEHDSVVLYGGEPTLRNDLFEIINIVKKNGFRRIKLVSNGRSFSNNQFLLQLIKEGCLLFEIKLWGSNPDIHDYITQTPNSFLQTINGLENLQRLSCDKFICLRILLCRQNFTDIVNMIITGINLGVNRIVLSLEDHNVPLQDLLPYIRIALNISILNRVWILTEGFPFCVMQGLEHHIGEIYHGYGSKIYPRTYKYHKNCQHCIYKGICHGVYTEYLNKFGHAEFQPIKFNRYFKEIKALFG